METASSYDRWKTGAVQQESLEVPLLQDETDHARQPPEGALPTLAELAQVRNAYLVLF